MDARLNGVLAKLNRAEEHLTELDAEIGRYLVSQPHKLIRHHEPGTRVVAIGWSVTKDPPLRASAILGDIVYNLRSSLDHLAWELVKLDGREPSVDRPRTQFPILAERPSSPVTIRPGISEAAQSLVDLVQPYQEGERFEMHPLWVLNELVNRDKHRELNLTTTRSLQDHIFLVDPATGRKFGGQFTAGVIHDNEFLGGWLLPEGMNAVPDDWEVESKGSAFVAIEGEGEWRNWPAVPFIDVIRVFIGNSVVTNAARLFE